MSEPLVIIGNGMAAARLCEELAKRGLGRYAVAVVGEEPRLAYNRVLLSSVLAGETGPRADVVALNAGAALYTSDAVPTISAGVDLAREAILNGKAQRTLAALVEFTNQ